MNGNNYLLDTNTIIDFSGQQLSLKEQQKIADIIDDTPQISVITKIELLCFSVASNQITLFTEQASVIGLDDDIVAQTIAIRRTYRIKLPDAIIAATAVTHDLTLITHNIVDFKKIFGLKLEDSHSS